MYGLLDGDIVVFRCGFAAERTRWHLSHGDTTEVFEYKREAMDRLDEVCPGKLSRVEGEDYRMWPEVELEPLSHALSNVKTLIAKICEACDITPFELKVAFSPKQTFRHKLAKTRPYKGNRKDGRRPAHEDAIKKYMKENYDCTTAEDEEADDLLAIWQTQYGPHDSVIVSLDKDLDQVPGLKYNWVHDVHYDIDEAKAMYNFHMQLLTGDSTDNIVGLPGIGPGKAAKALHGLETAQDQLQEVVSQYQIHSGKKDWYEYMIEMARLVWIRRYPNEDIAKSLDGNLNDPTEAWGEDELTLELT
jgi:hypothetical protein